MNFFKQAQEFAASAKVNTTDNDEAAAPASGGFESLMSGATSMLKTQTASSDAPAQSAEHSTLSEGRHAPSNQELMESSKLLFGAAQGQKVENTKLAGAAEDLLGGLAAHGKLDQGQYASYINQAEQYLHKYSGEDQAAARAAPAPAAEKEVSEAPAVKAVSEVPAEKEVSEVSSAEKVEPEASPAAAPAEEAAAAPAPKASSAGEGATEKFSLLSSVPSWMNDRA